MSDFDKEDDRAKLLVPKSINDGKVVKVSQKMLTTKKLVRTVLPEEQYVEKLDKIIEKDYFPELKKLKAQKEYLEAVATKDVTKIRELQLKFCSGSVRTDRSQRTPATISTNVAATPSGGGGEFSPPAMDAETPGTSYTKSADWMNTPIPFANEEGDNEALARKRKKKEEMSVTTYLNKYTSEDNASFEELHQVQRDREESKRKWMHQAEKEHNQSLIDRHSLAAEADVQLALKNASDADDARPLHLDNWKYTSWNTVLFHPEGVPLTEAEAAEAAKRQPPTINKRGTRYPQDLKLKPSEEALNQAARSHALQNAGKVDVHGHDVAHSTMLKMLGTPNPDPETMDSPFMTWGEIDGTPFRLDVPDVVDPTLHGSAPAFKIPEVPFREKIAQSINDSFAAKYRDKRKVAMKAAEGAHHTPKFGSSHRVSAKIAQLSPAAQKLATKKLGLKMAAVSPSASSSKRSSSSWSRTPGSSWSRPSTPGSSWSQGARTPSTPVVQMIRKKGTDEKRKKDNEGGEGGSRAKAGDFF